MVSMFPIQDIAWAAPASSLLVMREIRKGFDGVEVLHGVSFDVRAGEIHALVGENGAGKSTLMKILAGVYSDFTGEMRVEGRPVRFHNPREAERAGIAIIHQELSLVPYLSVAENMFLGREPLTRLGTVNHKKMRRDAETFLRDLAPGIDVRRPVAEFSVSVQQLIEIGKALSGEAKILILDEPTSALTEAETARLFDILRKLRSRGTGLIYISHKLDEIDALADRVTILRDGAWIGTHEAREISRDQMIREMVGRRIEQLFPERASRPGEELLRVENVSMADPRSPKMLVDDVSLNVCAGEIVGLGGLMGSGASELLGCIFGRYGRRAKGRYILESRPYTPKNPRHAIESGIALLTNDRKTDGLVLNMNVLHNMTLAGLERTTVRGLLSDRREREMASPHAVSLSLRAPSLQAPVTALSGGNQQKVVMSKWMMTHPKLLLLDEPTRGVDVGAKSEIYNLMNEWTSSGMGILLITSELPELLAMSDRILVMARGRITSDFSRKEATQERVMAAAV